jgi:hypothetical protein
VKKLFILPFLISLQVICLAQDNDLMRDIMMSKKAERDRQIEQAYEETMAGNYAIADELYRQILTTKQPIPSNLCFYFGKNSYHLAKYHQSIDWLNKYIELKGTEGAFFEETKKLLALNKKILQQERNIARQQTEEILSKSYDIDCGPSGKVTCPVCKGETVIIQDTHFGKNYKTCTYCDKDGNMSCEEYNRLLKGEL